MCTESTQKGVTLFELVLAIAVMSVALVAVVTTFTTAVKGSADPMVRQQAQLVAQAYLEEILLKNFYDLDTNTVCTGTTAGESRATYDNVCDYNGITESPPKNQLGNNTALSTEYSVTVAVTSDGSVDLNGLTNNVPGAVFRVLRVDVTVTGPGGTSVKLSGYRTNYNCNALPGDTECKPL